MEERNKSEFRLKLEHLWWSHKWLILSIAAVVVLIIFSVVSMVRKEDPDTNILYVGPLNLSISVQELLQDSLQDMIPDFNKDGEKIVLVNSISAKSRYHDYPILEEGDYVSDGEVILADPSRDVEYSQILINADDDGGTLEQFNLEVTIGDSVIYFIEEYYYDRVAAMNLLAPLDTILDEENMPENSRDEYSVYLKDMAIYSLPGFSSMPGDIIVCIRRFPDQGGGELMWGKSKEAYDANTELFNEMFAYNK